MSHVLDEFDQLCQRGLGFGPDGAGMLHSLTLSTVCSLSKKKEATLFFDITLSSVDICFYNF